MRQGTWWLLFPYLVVVVTCDSWAQTGSTLPTLEIIIARMAQARAENQACFRPYNVTRDYKLFGKDRVKIKSQVVADIAFIPPDAKKYAIQQTSGTGLGKTIVRRTLASEVDIAKDHASTDFSADNYDFRFIREENLSDQRCYVLELRPKRKDKSLLIGNIWIDATTYLVRRVRGEPAKSPSWWLRGVRITLLYGDVGGMWLQTDLEATATVRIFGPHTLVSRDVKYRISELVVASCRKQLSKAYARLIPSAPCDQFDESEQKWTPSTVSENLR
ncbi:MAG: outer membrane lipoprotein-sorting protein [Acidobacteria bacterium]|nr:MAG: outer membrane lipoprotein-sorting protein [Acidobacteriota bacterium]